MAQDVSRAIAVRDAARTRLRRATVVGAAASVASTMLLAGLAAGSTHLRKLVPARRAVPGAAHTRAPVKAPAPPLVAAAGPASAAASPPPAPAPSPAPAAVPQAPVVVSGGS